MRIEFIVFLILLSASCQALPSLSPTPTPHIADKDAASANHWTRHEDNEMSLRIEVPTGWETYNTDAGIVLNEHMGTGAPGSPLRGFLIHIFVPYLSKLEMPEASDVNMAWYVLKQVVHNPDYVGDALVSEPVAFRWDIYDAAYYLLNNRDNTVTMLLALGMPDRHSLVVCHVSVPLDQAQRIRPLLPDLLATLTIDGKRIDVSALRELPNPLVFPAE